MTLMTSTSSCSTRPSPAIAELVDVEASTGSWSAIAQLVDQVLDDDVVHLDVELLDQAVAGDRRAGRPGPRR
jgi:hypothetical protein